MASTIIVPLAGPQRDPDRVGEMALPLARALATHHDVAITLLSVVELPLPFADTVDTADEALVDEREAYLRGLADAFDDVTSRITVRQDIDIADQVRRAVAESAEPIIVMASHCRRGLRRTLLGSVAFEVVQSVPCPVIVVPATADDAADHPRRMDKVLIPLDGSSGSEASLDAALAVLEGLAPAIHLVGVTEPAAEPASQVTNGYLERIAERLVQAGHRVTWETRIGTPEEQIVLATRASDAGLIAMATHARTGVSRFVLGSVAESVLRDGGRPVILTRPTDAETVPPSERQERSSGVPLRQVMSAPVAAVLPDMPAGDVAQIMLDRNLGYVLVVARDDTPIGVITPSDITSHAGQTASRDDRSPASATESVRSEDIERSREAVATLTARDIMRAPIVTVSDEATVGSAIAKVIDTDIDHIAVMSGDVPVGIVSRDDLLRQVARQNAGSGSVAQEERE